MAHRLPIISYKKFLLVTLAVSLLYLWFTGFGRNSSTYQETAAQHLASKSIYHQLPHSQESVEKDQDESILCRPRVLGTKDREEAEAYFTQSHATCDHQKKVEFCHFKSTARKPYHVNCILNDCQKEIHLSYFHMDNGPQWKPSVKFEDVDSTVEKIAHEREHSGFIYIICEDTAYHHEDLWLDPSLMVQMLIIPLELSFPVSLENITISKKSLNYNFIFIDSVSRDHFRRSLTLTKQKFRELAATSNTKILDYTTFQSLKSRTFENLQALFSGVSNTSETFSTLAMPKRKLNIETMFKPLLKKGYTSLWLEDLCWDWEWGISKDLLVRDIQLNRKQYWKKLRDAFSEARISSFGISPSSCEMMSHNGKPDPFHGMPAVCMGGQFQHDYLLEYLQLYQDYQVSRGQPYISFLLSDVGHDDDGTRVKGIDSRLAEFIQASASQTNTLTVLLSDHGNAYGQYVQKSNLARYETYNPMLYIVAPQGVQTHLGYEAMSHLSDNQHKLVTMLDIHHMIMSSINLNSKTDNRGLLGEIAKSKTCANLPLHQPSLCICTGSSEQDSPAHLPMLAEFSAGILNNHIFDHVGGSHRAACRILLPHNFTFIQRTKSQKEDKLTSTLDIHIPHPTLTGESESFFVSVDERISRESQSDDSSAAMVSHIDLVMFERISLYGIYRPCGDGPQTEQLCICEKDKPFIYNNASTWLTTKLPQHHEMQVHTLQVSPQTDCFVIVLRCWMKGLGCSMYAANSCDHVFSIVCALKQRSTALISTSSQYLKVNVSPGDVRFILVVWSTDPIDFTQSFSISISPI